LTVGEPHEPGLYMRSPLETEPGTASELLAEEREEP